MGKGKKLNTREEILGLQRTLRVVPVSTDDGVFYIKEMTGTERDEWEQLMVRARDADNYIGTRGVTLALAIVDSEGNRLFDVDKDADALGALPVSVTQPVFNAWTKLNRIGEGDLKELEGNS